MQYFKNMKTLNKKRTFDKVTGIQMERSPQKWKTMYRDEHRQFSGSPAKDADMDASQEEVYDENYPVAQRSNQNLFGSGLEADSSKNVDLKAISSGDNLKKTSSGNVGKSKEPSDYHGRRGGVQFQHEESPTGM